MILGTVGWTTGGRAEPASPAAPLPPAPRAPLCSGAYADDFTSLSAEAREFDRRPEAVFSYCVRNTAVYECLSYGADGTIRRDKKRATLHGTAFAYKRQAGDTLLLTNDHVAAWPAVTDAQHTVDGVPVGCKKISESLTLVDDEHDAYALDDIPLTRVVTDPQLDVAILKAHAELQVMRWKIGKSAELSERDVVEVRGFPLGAFRATNVGTVVSLHDHDDYGDWDHEDFVIDALLSSGNSGSPVLAVSCATGEYELVGIFHAGYTEGSALNVVVGIDQVRDLMTTLKRKPRDRDAVAVAPGGAGRVAVEAGLDVDGETFFAFGPLVALVRARPDHGLLFAVLSKDFPRLVTPLFAVEDLAANDPLAFGTRGRIWLGGARGLEAVDPKALDPEATAEVQRALDALRADAAAAIAYRSAGAQAGASRQSTERLAKMAETLTRTAAARADLVQTVSDLAERLGPPVGRRGATLAEITAVAAPAAAPTPQISKAE
ncbi:MAG TPA: S1C family serine protease [Polyangia bacterium]|nr:S1C family serine protease [Polyangia bacterium]